MRTATRSGANGTSDGERLALLWKAFEGAEQRIAELETELDAMRNGRASNGKLQVQVDVPEAIAAVERGSAERHRATLAAIEKLEGEMREARASESRTASDLSAERAKRAELEGSIAEASRALVAERAATARERERASHLQSAFLVSERTMSERACDLERALAQAMTERAELAHALTAEEIAMMARGELIADLDEALESVREEARASRASEAEARAHVARLQKTLVAARAEWAPVNELPIAPTRIPEIPGVTERECTVLRRFGVNFADSLLYADLATLAPASGIPLPRLAKLRSLAEIMTIEGIGTDWAERLFAAGVRTVRDVAALPPETLAGIVLHSYGEEGRLADADAFLLPSVVWRSRVVVESARRAVE